MAEVIVDITKEFNYCYEIVTLQEKLEIALKALKMYAKEDDWEDCVTDNSIAPVFCPKGCFYTDGYLIAKNALTEIEEVDNDD